MPGGCPGPGFLILRFGGRLSFQRFGLKVVLWFSGPVLRSPGPLVTSFPGPWSCAFLVLSFLGPVLSSVPWFSNLLLPC